MKIKTNIAVIMLIFLLIFIFSGTLLLLNISSMQTDARKLHSIDLLLKTALEFNNQIDLILLNKAQTISPVMEQKYKDLKNILTEVQRHEKNTPIVRQKTESIQSIISQIHDSYVLENEKLPVSRKKELLKLLNNETLSLIYFFSPIKQELSDRIMQEGDSFYLKMSLMIVFLGIVFLLLLLYIHRTIVNPVNLLKKDFQKMTAGSFTFHTETRGNNEFAELLSTFEELVKKRNQAEDKIQKSFDEMEMRVSERTAELIAEKKELKKEITRRQQAEHVLITEKLFSDYIINSIPGLIVIFDVKGKAVKWNHNTSLFFKQEPGSVKEANIFDFIAEADRKKAELAIDKMLSRGKASEVLALLTPDKETRPFYFTGTKIQINMETYIIGWGLEVTRHPELIEILKSRETTS